MTTPPDYTPPPVWTWNKANGGALRQHQPADRRADPRQGAARRSPSRSSSTRWARPTAQKVTVMLEELLARWPQGRRVRRLAHPASARATSSAPASSRSTPTPRSRLWSTAADPTPIRVFESGAILLHLAEKFGAFLPTDRPILSRAECLSWLFWQMGSRALPRRRLRPLLRLCAEQDRIRHRPLRHGDQAPDGRARPPARRIEISWRATTTPSPTWRCGRGTAVLAKGLLYERRRVPGGARTTSTSSAGPTAIGARPAVKRGRMVNRAAGRPGEPSCTSVTTPATSSTKTQDKIAPAT